MIRYTGSRISNILVNLAFKRFNSTFDSLASSSPLLSNLYPTCTSCGIRLQTVDKSKPGYYIPVEDRKSKEKVLKDVDLTFQSHIEKLSQEDQNLLINDTTSKKSNKSSLLYHSKNILSDAFQKEKIELKKRTKDNSECVRCRDATYRSNFKEIGQTEFPVRKLEDIMKEIPPHEKIMYIVSAQDFPLSLNPAIFQYRLPNDIKFIINKSDLLFKTNNLSLKYGKSFFQDYLRHKYGVPPENVFITSAKTDWNINSLLNFIDDTYYLIGKTNSGKSSLMKSFLYSFEVDRMKNRLLNSKEKIQLEKQEDIKMNTSLPFVSNSRGDGKRFKEYFNKIIGPGASYVPGYTRGFIRVDLPNNKVIYDVPGFMTSEDIHSFYSLLDTHKIKDLSKGALVYERGMYNSRYETLKGGQTLTVGGLFYLNTPKESIYQIRNCINSDLQVFRDFSKAIQVSKKLDPSLANKFVIKNDDKSISELESFIIPPFYGAIDLVISNFGHISIIPTGAKKTNQPLIVYLPKGVEAVVRQPISQYIAKTLTGRDKKGNILRKENLVLKSTKAVKRYNKKNPFASRLIPFPTNELKLILNNEEISENFLQNQKSATYDKINHLGRLSDKAAYDDQTVLNEENCYDYWIE
ncbi:genetic interactor of prohibitins 3, mitochondrial [Scheffersomyces amazonensis]|uniref:genetic interactor of prohibitins 3, mitochondrial n=1 Tax=Scheffersomyces amazonensis TaxID=1078765 RepID=UPI00315D7C2D